MTDREVDREAEDDAHDEHEGFGEADDDADDDAEDAAEDAARDADVAEVRAALDAEDDDLLEPDVFDDDEDDEPGGDDRPPRRRFRLGLAPSLVLLGGAAWAVVMAMRCGPAPEAELSVPTAEAPEDTRAPTPATDSPTPERAPKVEHEPETPDEPDDPPDEPDTPDEVEPSDWAKNVEVPQVVTYTVRHGGSIKNVANLFKIYHHEIEALNPGVPLDKELPPGTAVTVYRAEPGTPSESVGTPSGGSLEGAVPMLPGPGRVLKMIPWKGWATANTVATLDRVLGQWAADETNSQPVLVGNMSARNGGKLEPHSTHQSGRDVDLGYIQKELPPGEELNWREMTSANLDAAGTWKLLQLLRATGQIEVVFIDSKLQKLLYEWGLHEGGMSKATLRKWLEYPRSPPVRNAIVQHVNGHTDHLHARFKCRPEESRCKSRSR